MISSPTLDLHGESKDAITFLVNDFINDNYQMQIEKVIIVHGKGFGILRRRVHELLSENKLVIDYKLDNWNLGSTIVNINRVKRIGEIKEEKIK